MEPMPRRLMAFSRRGVFDDLDLELPQQRHERDHAVDRLAVGEREDIESAMHRVERLVLVDGGVDVRHTKRRRPGGFRLARAGTPPAPTRGSRRSAVCSRSRQRKPGRRPRAGTSAVRSSALGMTVCSEQSRRIWSATPMAGESYVEVPILRTALIDEPTELFRCFSRGSRAGCPQRPRAMVLIAGSSKLTIDDVPGKHGVVDVGLRAHPGLIGIHMTSTARPSLPTGSGACTRSLGRSGIVPESTAGMSPDFAVRPAGSAGDLDKCRGHDLLRADLARASCLSAAMTSNVMPPSWTSVRAMRLRRPRGPVVSSPGIASIVLRHFTAETCLPSSSILVRSTIVRVYVSGRRAMDGSIVRTVMVVRPL